MGFVLFLLLIIFLVGSIWKLTLEQSYQKGYKDGNRKKLKNESKEE